MRRYIESSFAKYFNPILCLMPFHERSSVITKIIKKVCEEKNEMRDSPFFESQQIRIAQISNQSNPSLYSRQFNTFELPVYHGITRVER